jgi:uncharacterized coiled-coil DUF342 family protein
LSDRRQIEELNEKISSLKGQRDNLEAEAHEWAEKRDKLNEKFKKLRDETSNLKGERDTANDKVKELKLKRDEAKARISQKIQELRILREELNLATKKKPSRTFRSLQEQFDAIEWKIQTTPMSLNEEKELVEQVKQTETQLNIYKKLEQLRQKSLDARAQITAQRVESQSCHDLMTKTAQKGQEYHKKLLSKMEESRKVKAEADTLHQTFVQTREKARSIQNEIIRILDQMRRLKGEVRQKEDVEKKQTEKAMLNELETLARQKLKRGEKLTWEEFQLLAEKGLDAEDKSE